MKKSVAIYMFILLNKLTVFYVWTELIHGSSIYSSQLLIRPNKYFHDYRFYCVITEISYIQISYKGRRVYQFICFLQDALLFSPALNFDNILILRMKKPSNMTILSMATFFFTYFFKRISLNLSSVHVRKSLERNRGEFNVPVLNQI